MTIHAPGAMKEKKRKRRRDGSVDRVQSPRWLPPWAKRSEVPTSQSESGNLGNPMTRKQNYCFCKQDGS